MKTTLAILLFITKITFGQSQPLDMSHWQLFGKPITFSCPIAKDTFKVNTDTMATRWYSRPASKELIAYSKNSTRKITHIEGGTGINKSMIIETIGDSSVLPVQWAHLPGPEKIFHTPEDPGNRDNINPIANAGADQAITIGRGGTLWAKGYSPNKYPIVGYHWEQMSGPDGAVIDKPYKASTKVHLKSVGVYIFNVTATDSKGYTGSDFVAIEVNDSAILKVDYDTTFILTHMSLKDEKWGGYNLMDSQTVVTQTKTSTKTELTTSAVGNIVEVSQKQTVYSIPEAYVDELLEITIIKDKNNTGRTVTKIVTCKQFKEFKKKYPYFIIPKRVLNKFHCK